MAFWKKLNLLFAAFGVFIFAALLFWSAYIENWARVAKLLIYALIGGFGRVFVDAFLWKWKQIRLEEKLDE